MNNVLNKESLIDRTIADLKNVPENMRREFVVALLTCVALETGYELCDSMRLLHGAMEEIDKLFEYDYRGNPVNFEGMVN